jgi:hypothetical protein
MISWYILDAACSFSLAFVVPGFFWRWLLRQYWPNAYPSRRQRARKTIQRARNGKPGSTTS